MCSKNAKYVWKLQPYTVCRANYVIFEAEQLQECSCKQMNERKNALSTLSLSEKNTARFLRTVLQHCTPVSYTMRILWPGKVFQAAIMKVFRHQKRRKAQAAG
jgi:hypothetical protein